MDSASHAAPDDTDHTEPAGAGARTLQRALIDSRQRWRDLVALAADIAFETDSWGRFTFVSPEPALGWSPDTLIGQPSELILPEFGGLPGFNPFRPTGLLRQRRAWVKRPDGSIACLSMSAAPIFDAAGQFLGARGIGFDLTVQDRHEAELAGALRRWEVLDHILRHMRAELLAPRMMQAALEALVSATGAAGALVIDAERVDAARHPIAPHSEAEGGPVLHRVGTESATVAAAALSALQADLVGTIAIDSEIGERLILCPSTTRFVGRPGLVLWRPAAARGWDSDDLALLGSATSIIRLVLEHEAIQNQMALQARTDPLTNLPNRRAFLDDAPRRIERLDRESLPGTLVYIDLDGFRRLNERLGHDVGDMALQALTALLRQTFRPTDLLCRIGGDEFAVWVDGADSFIAAERAEALCRQAPIELAFNADPDLAEAGTGITLSIGIAMRWPGGEEDVETLIRQADHAMSTVKASGGGQWRVFRAEPGT